MAASHLKAIATLLNDDDDNLLSSPLSSPLFTDSMSNQQTIFEKKQAERIEKLKATQDRINKMKLKRNRSPVKQQQVRRESSSRVAISGSATPANTPVKPIANNRVDSSNKAVGEDKNGIFSPTRPTATTTYHRASMLGQPRLMIHTYKEEATPDSYIGELEEITPTSLLQFNSNDELVDNELELVDDGLEEEGIEDDVQNVKGDNRRETASAEELQLTLQDYQSSTTIQQQQQYKEDEIVFGNSSNTNQFELANVKQRAEAINIWKAQKEKIEECHHNGGRSRAREWSVLGGGGVNGVSNRRGVGNRGGRKSLGCVRELDTGSGSMKLLDYNQPEKSMKKTMVVPSFLSQFESSTPKNDEENQENCINGGIPSTPRRYTSSPSPRNNNSNSSIPLSPRVALSPRNDPRSPRVALSPRVGSINGSINSKKKKKKNVALSPRNNIPPSPSRHTSLPSPSRTVFSSNTYSSNVMMTSSHHLPPISPRTLPTPRATRASMSPAVGKERLSSFFEDEEENDNVVIKVETRYMPSTHLDDVPLTMLEATIRDIESTKQDDMIPPSTPVSKVMEDAMNFLKANPEGGGQVVDIEPDGSNVFFSDTNRRGSVAGNIDNHDEIVEDCDELEIAQQLAMALDQFLIQEGGDNSGNNNDRYEADKELMSGGNSNALLDVEQLALALDQFLVNDNDNREDGDEAVGEVSSIVKEEEDQGWTETQSKDVQVKKSTNEKQDVGDVDFTFPVNFDAFGQSSGSFNNGGSDGDTVFFPTSFGTDVQPPVTKKASQRPPKKSKKLTISTSFMTSSSSTVDYHKKLHPKIKICIDGAPELNITRKEIAKEENLFYINQPSPSVGDKACLLSGSGPQTSSMPPSPAVADHGVKAVEDCNSNNKPMLNLRGLLNTARPIPKRDIVSIQKGTSGIHSPSMIGLLASSSSSNEPSRLAMNKNVIVSSSEKKEVVEGQFFVAPATPTMESYQQISIGHGSTKKTSGKIVVPSSSTSVGFGSVKKSRKLLQRIKKGGKNKSSSSAFGSLLND